LSALFRQGGGRLRKPGVVTRKAHRRSTAGEGAARS
jgi:hypothetical protein